jgi:hypothetical protein
VAKKDWLARSGANRCSSSSRRTGLTAFAVNVDNVIKIEPSPPETDLPTTALTYIDGESDTVLGNLQITIKRLNGETSDVTSLG